MRRDLQNLPHKFFCSLFRAVPSFADLDPTTAETQCFGGQRNKGGSDRSIFHPDITPGRIGTDHNRQRGPFQEGRPVFFGPRQSINKALVIDNNKLPRVQAPRRGRPQGRFQQQRDFLRFHRLLLVSPDTPSLAHNREKLHDPTPLCLRSCFLRHLCLPGSTIPWYSDRIFYISPCYQGYPALFPPGVSYLHITKTHKNMLKY